MGRSWKTLAAVAAVVVFGLPVSARAASITIDNAGFENPDVSGATYGTVTDWILSGGGGGVWDLTSNLGGCPGQCWSTLAPEGNQIGWLSVGPTPGSPASLSQTLSAVLLANNTYTLTGFVGHPNNFQAGTSYTVELLAGGTVLDSITGQGPSGAFDPFTLTYFSGNSPAIGQQLEIRLSSNQAQTGFDDLRLSVPDGGLTLALFGGALLGLGALRRRFRL